MSLSSYLSMREMQAPIILYFEHLDSEYRTLKARITDAEDINTLDLLNEKRKSDDLSWNDLYTFELILTKYRPRERLRSKVLQLRNDYRSVAGQQEYDEYIASKPPNLLEPPDPENPPDADSQELENLLREDIKDLLSRLFLLYEILPVREAKLKGLTWWAAGLCLAAMALIFIIVTVMFVFDPARPAQAEWRIPTLTIFVVAIVGAMGGFVSAVQRIQKPPEGGDSFYNLARMFYASYSVFVAPITGAIFAILLYLMFTAGILKGSFFPNIYTPPAAYQDGGAPKPASSPSPAPTATPQTTAQTTSETTSETATRAALTAQTGAPNLQPQQNSAGRSSSTGNTTNIANTSNAATSTNTAASSNTAANQPATNAAGNTSANQSQAGATGNANAAATPQGSPSPVPTPVPVATKSLGVKDFLAQSGPAGGVDYAMLILWCFIAGFAERFVPDALDRLISQKNSSGNKP
jgi:hypothetical protein